MWLVAVQQAQKTAPPFCYDTVKPVNLKRLLNIPSDKSINVHGTYLTFIGKPTEVTTDEINVCPMDTKAFIVRRRFVTIEEIQAAVKTDLEPTRKSAHSV